MLAARVVETRETGPTAVVAALPEELSGILSRTRDAKTVRVGRRRVVCGRLGRAPVVVLATGDGRQAARDGLTALLEAAPVGAVLAIGIGGGLTPALEPGSLVVARRVLDGRSSIEADPAWLGRAARVSGATIGVCVTTPRILARSAEKRAAARAIGEAVPATVDLESWAYAQAAAEHGVPFLAVRAVSDAAWEDLPLDFNAFLGPRGGVSRLRVVAHAIAHPRSIPDLVRVRRRVGACADRLAAFVVGLLDGGLT